MQFDWKFDRGRRKMYQQQNIVLCKCSKFDIDLRLPLKFCAEEKWSEITIIQWFNDLSFYCKIFAKRKVAQWYFLLNKNDESVSAPDIVKFKDFSAVRRKNW